MGDPRKHRKTYSTPSHPWNKERLDTEKSYIIKYGLVNKKEVYKTESMLRNIKLNAKRLLRSQPGPQRDKEHTQMMDRLKSLNLLNAESTDDTILSLTASDLLNRRLQSIVHKKGLASSVKQARQFIVHEHILVGDKKITSPSYLVTREEESKIAFSPSSNLSKEDHPERRVQTDRIKKEVEIIKPKVDEKRLLEEDVIPEEKEIPEEEIEIEVQEVIEDFTDIEDSSEEAEEKSEEVAKK